MRLSFGSIAPPLLVLFGIGCNTVSPDECWPNTSGGFGGEGTIPIGAGVGATTGDYLDPPPRGPLDHGGTPNPCVTTSSPSPSPKPKEKQCKGASGQAGDSQSYTFCSDSCPESDARCVAGVIAMFRPSNFSFFTVVADDGANAAGGWQEARTQLAFADGLFNIVTCQVRVGMPLRAESFGKIPAGTAAIYSANVANAAAGKLWPTDVPPGVFCSTLKEEMKVQFKYQYQNLGARVMDP